MKNELSTDDGRHTKREFAKMLRKNLTPQEVLVWEQLKNKKMYGLKFRRQAPIGPYIADFLCVQRKIIIEIDGTYHLFKKEYDADRDKYLLSLGFTVIRLTNKEVEVHTKQILEMRLKQFNLN